VAGRQHLPAVLGTRAGLCSEVPALYSYPVASLGTHVRHPPHSKGWSGCSRSAMKSSENFDRFAIGVSQHCVMGSKTAALPTRLTSTSCPANRNSLGRRAAWLSPFVKKLGLVHEDGS
jgi:hypothetical protein